MVWKYLGIHRSILARNAQWDNNSNNGKDGELGIEKPSLSDINRGTIKSCQRENIAIDVDPDKSQEQNVEVTSSGLAPAAFVSYCNEGK